MSRFTLLVTANAFRASGAEAEAPVRAVGGEILYPPRMGPLSPEELIPYLQQADAVVAATDPYITPVLEACPRLKVVSRWGTGYDSVKLADCTAAGQSAVPFGGVSSSSALRAWSRSAVRAGTIGTGWFFTWNTATRSPERRRPR